MTRCMKSIITLSTRTLEKIVNSPEIILENWEAFWEDERPQKLTKLWAEGVKYAIPFDEWKLKFQKWADLSLEARKNHIFMKNTHKIVESKEIFRQKALPLICAYLPGEVDIDVTIHFTAFIPSNAFAWQDIVISVNAPHWNDNPDNVLNILVHEIFHAGYSFCRELRSEEPLEDESVYRMLDNFQSEGICTYVGYQALEAFPAPDEKDYQLLDNILDVQRLLKDLNEVFSKVRDLSTEDLQKLAWEKCVIGRAYYVVGAYMCKIIEEKEGREALIQTLTTGPLSFIKRYNSLVNEELEINLSKILY
ncbi:MAG: DUF5700 domain-containing putative Zn-dependent protease [Candidatus Hodarchaeota archaeon]